MVTNGICCYVALLIDYPEKNLFCGQVGEIQHVQIDQNENFYFLIFIDFQNNENNFAYCVVEKNYLLPLFSSDPDEDQKIEIPFQEDKNKKPITLQEVRDKWEEFQVHNISTLGLKLHKKVASRFEIGQLVTLQFDIEQKMSNNEAFTIQAGQVGIISKTQDLDTGTQNLDTETQKLDTETQDLDLEIQKLDNCVEVTFLSIPFGELAREREKLVSLSTSSRERKICIHKDFLFPLYCEKLN
jgi:hypothetical protein